MIGSLIQAFLSLAVVTGVALLIGFEPRASFGDWLTLVGLLAAVTFALVWLTVAIGQDLWIAPAWCAGIALLGYLWAKKLYNRKV